MKRTRMLLAIGLFAMFSLSFVLRTAAAPDVATVSIVSPKTVVGQSFFTTINVTVTNLGSLDETFNVTLYRSGEMKRVVLSGSASQGWNNSIPGPTITANEGDTINLTLISADGMTHQFFVDYNGNGVPDVGEPTSPTFTGTIDYAFVVTVNGIFNYFCSIHPGTMHGTFSVNSTAIATRINSQTVNPPLTPGENRTLSFLWNTTNVPYGNYTISAVADTVPGEVNTIDNTLSDGWIVVSVACDITGPTGFPDGKTDLRDIGLIVNNFGRSVPPGSPNCDVTGPVIGLPDGKIDMRDVGLAAADFGKHV